MKQIFISPNKARDILSNKLECALENNQQFVEHCKTIPQSTSFMDAVKTFLNAGNELITNSGARILYYAYPEDSCKPWLLSGYTADGKDVDCYFDKQMYAVRVKHKCIIERPSDPQKLIGREIETIKLTGSLAKIGSEVLRFYSDADMDLYIARELELNPNTICTVLDRGSIPLKK